MPLQPTGLVVEATQGGQFLIAPEPRALYRRFEHPDRLVVDFAAVIRSASHFGTCPPCSGKSAVPAFRAIASYRPPFPAGVVLM